MAKKTKKITEVVKENAFESAEHIIMDTKYNVLYCNNDIVYKAMHGKIALDNKKCYEIYKNNEPCHDCRLSEVLTEKKSVTWEMNLRNAKGYEVRREVTLYPTFNSKNEVEKIVSVRLEKKEYKEDSIVEVFACIAESKEDYIKEHSKNVHNICKAIGQEMKLEPEQMKNLEIAARLHDIGNIVIDDDILGKKSKLTDKEVRVLRRHPEYSEEILKKFKPFNEVSKIVRHHHERYDGTGYPDRIAGDKIPLESRIIAIANAYEAMTSHRVYKEKKSEKDIIKEIVELAGAQFDPKVVRAMLSIMSKIRRA